MKKTLRLKESELVDLIESTVKENIISQKPVSENEVRRVKTRFEKWAKLNEGQSPTATFNSFHKECYKLKAHGYSEDVICEALKRNKSLNEQGGFGEAGGGKFSALDSLWLSLREGFYGWILEKFGATGETKIFLRSVLGNVPIWDLPQLLMNCDVLVKAIVKGLPEYVAGWLNRSTLFGGKDTNLGLVMNNAIGEFIHTSDWFKGMEEKIRGMICDGHKVKTDKIKGIFNIKDLLGKVTGGGQ